MQDAKIGLDPPFYRSPPHLPSFPALLRRGISDPASTFSASVYETRALKLSRLGPIVVTPEMAAILSTLVRRFRFIPSGEEPVASLRIGTYSLNGQHAAVERLE